MYLDVGNRILGILKNAFERTVNRMSPNGKAFVSDYGHWRPENYRACQGLWPSLMFADENIEPQNFGLHPKVMLPHACIFVVITLVGPTKVSIMKLKWTLVNRMWQLDFLMKLIFFSSIFSSQNTG